MAKNKSSKMTFEQKCLIRHFEEGGRVKGGKGSSNYNSLPLFQKDEVVQTSLFEMVNETPK